MEATIGTLRWMPVTAAKSAPAWAGSTTATIGPGR
jgi:hypothetical protein